MYPEKSDAESIRGGNALIGSPVQYCRKRPQGFPSYVPAVAGTVWRPGQSARKPNQTTHRVADKQSCVDKAKGVCGRENGDTPELAKTDVRHESEAGA